MEEIENRIHRIAERVNIQAGKRDVLQNEVKSKEKESRSLITTIARTTAGRDLLVKASDEAREQGRKLLEETATKIVQTVFGNSYKVTITLAIHGGTPVADVLLNKEINNVPQDIDLDSEGGGLKDLTALAIFVAVGQLTGEQNQAPLLLDEPTKFVSDGRAAQAAQAIKSLGSLLDKQLVIVTNEREELPAIIDKVYTVDQDSQAESHIL